MMQKSFSRAARAATTVSDSPACCSIIEAETILAGCKCDTPRVVAILGPQSSGKSTLLNGVFETSFEVMDETNRKQTTHGTGTVHGC